MMDKVILVKQKRKVIRYTVICVVLLLMGAICFRIVYVNLSSPKREEIIYNKNEWVELEDDFLYSKDENCNGYSIIVTETKWLSVQELKNELGDSTNSNFTGNRTTPVVLISIKIRNIGNENGYLFLKQYLLINRYGNTFYSFDADLLNKLNPELGEANALSIPSNSEFDLVIPYVIDELRADGKNNVVDSQQESPYYLSITEYPTQKRIRITFE